MIFIVCHYLQRKICPLFVLYANIRMYHTQHVIVDSDARQYTFLFVDNRINPSVVRRNMENSYLHDSNNYHFTYFFLLSEIVKLVFTIYAFMITNNEKCIVI